MNFPTLIKFNRCATYVKIIGKLRGVKISIPSYEGKVVGSQKGRPIVELRYPDGNLRNYVFDQSALEITGSEEKGKRHVKSKPSLSIMNEFTRIGGQDFPRLTTASAQRKLASDLKLRGLQYGNSMTDDEREHHTKRTLEAFHDLAEVTGLPVEKISMNGRLALAFGARGKGGAAAHYEPGTKTINLTRFSGMGALAHEWGHFFDNTVSNVNRDIKDSGYITMGNFKEKKIKVVTGSPDIPHGAIYGRGKGGRFFYDSAVEGKHKWKKLLPDQNYPGKDSKIIGFKEGFTVDVTVPDDSEQGKVLNKMKEISDYAYESLKDGLKLFGPYWSKKNELFARSFETYVKSKLQEKKRRNTYLQDDQVMDSDDGLKIYPQKEVRSKLNKMFDDLFVEVKKSDILSRAFFYL